MHLKSVLIVFISLIILSGKLLSQPMLLLDNLWELKSYKRLGQKEINASTCTSLKFIGDSMLCVYPCDNIDLYRDCIPIEFKDHEIHPIKMFQIIMDSTLLMSYQYSFKDSNTLIIRSYNYLWELTNTLKYIKKQ